MKISNKMIEIASMLNTQANDLENNKVSNVNGFSICNNPKGTTVNLSKKLRELASGLVKKANEINSNQCEHGIYKNKFLGNEECKPCGSPKLVICKIKAGGRNSHSSSNCRPGICPHFESLKKENYKNNDSVKKGDDK